MNLVVDFQLSQLPSARLVRSTRQALSMQTYAGRDSSVGKMDSRKRRMFVGDSALGNLAHAMTTPHGAQTVSTQ